MANIKNIIDYLSGRGGFYDNRKGRDVLLDFAKGVGVLLVVLGHTIQDQTAHFDDLYGFRFIYSFHMPFFAFLAGASSAFWIRKINILSPVSEIIQDALSRIKKSAVHLLIPFVTWTLIGYWLNGNPDPIIDYLRKVMKQPDYSLWFLPCIFWCTTYIALFMLAIEIAMKGIEKTSLKRINYFLELLPVQVLVMFFAWRILIPMLPKQAGLVFPNYFHGGLFFFFLLGLAFFKSFSTIKIAWIRVIPYLIFFLLVPFWHRTMPNSIIAGAPNFFINTWFVKYYSVVVATAGTLVFVDLSRIFNSHLVDEIKVVMCYIGAASLGVYAVHFYFLGYNPPIVSAIFFSLIIYQAVLFIPVARTVVFGK